MDNGMRRQQLYELLGRLPDRNRTIGVEQLHIEERQEGILEKLVLDLNGEEPVPAYYLRPRRKDGPFPVILYNHSHGGFYDVGKEELFRGAPYLQKPSYGEALTDAGYAVLAIDHWGFGERSGRSESSIFKQMIWRGQVMWGMMVYDSLRAIDYLQSRGDVDAERIGTLGMSMGSTMAWWTAALDPRIKVTVDLCCLTDFDSLIESAGLDGHGIYYYVPDLLNHFTASDINALIAPRPHLGLAGIQDRLTPPDGLARIDRHLRQIYEEFQAAEAWKMVLADAGHQETPEMRQEVMSFLNRWL